MPIRKDLPSTIARSEKHAQDIFAETHDSAVEQYGEGERAHRTAFASLKHSYKKEGDKWVPKASKGPSDPQAVVGTKEPKYTLDSPSPTRASSSSLRMVIPPPRRSTKGV